MGEGLVDLLEQFLHGEGLRQPGGLSQCGGRGGGCDGPRDDAGIAGDEENFQCGEAGLKLRGHVGAGEAAEVDIADEQVGRDGEALREFEGVTAVGTGVDLKPALGESHAKELADGGVVVDQKDDGLLAERLREFG